MITNCSKVKTKPKEHYFSSISWGQILISLKCPNYNVIVNTTQKKEKIKARINCCTTAKQHWQLAKPFPCTCLDQHHSPLHPGTKLIKIRDLIRSQNQSPFLLPLCRYLLFSSSLLCCSTRVFFSPLRYFAAESTEATSRQRLVSTAASWLARGIEREIESEMKGERHRWGGRRSWEPKRRRERENRVLKKP